RVGLLSRAKVLRTAPSTIARRRGLPAWGIALGALAVGLVPLLLLPDGARTSPTPSPKPIATVFPIPTVPALAAVGAPTKPAACQFVMGFKQLHDKIPNVVGDCAEDERWVPERNVTEQRTTRGMLVWRKSDGLTAFTDGYRTWVDGPTGVQQ